MVTSYSLLTEPWIPLVDRNGDHGVGSLSDALLTPQKWIGIVGSSPIETISLYRLLLAICHRAIGPDPDPRIGLLSDWPTLQVESYLVQWENHFDLLHPATPFLQVAALKDSDLTHSPWTRIALDCSTGAARLIWDHSIDMAPKPQPLDISARLLVAHLQFTPGGLVKALRTSAVRGPGAGLLLTLPTGGSLQETLALSLVPQSRDDYESDLPSWEREPLGIEDLRKPKEIILEGPAHRYTMLSRAVLLLAEGRSVRHVLYAEGAVATDASSPRVDPMASVITGKKGSMPLLISEHKGFWRDFQALSGGAGTTAAATVNHAIDLRIEQGENQILNLIAGGLLPDQAKIILWRLEERRVAPALLRSAGLIRSTEKALELAEVHGQELGKALFILYTEWLKQGQDKKPDPAAIRSVRDSIQASATYWSLLEPAFWVFIQSLGDGVDSEEALLQWRTELRRAVLSAWEQANASLGLDSRALAAVGRSSRSIAKILAGLSP